ncbi:MAG: hypothetical protein HYS27_13270 [Deltaproteobacteria bacterium]|nr:hypothetical protein [Deltaproteobacteria bacterium]
MVTCSLALLLVAAVDPALVGQWSGPGGIGLTVQKGGACRFDVDAGSCRTEHGTLFFTVDGETEQVRYSIVAGALTIVDVDGSSLVLHRVGSAPPAAATGVVGAPAPAPAPPTAAPPKPVAAAPKAVGKGTPFTQKGWGASFTIPGGWKAGEKDGLVLAGSDTEAGLIVVRFYPAATRADLEQGFQQGFHDNGMNAQPSTALSPFSAKGGQALAGDLAGADAQGNELSVRTVAVMTPFGGAPVVAGLTTPPQFATVKARADALAASASFTRPPKVSTLAGDYQWFYLSKDGQYSREARITLCQSGAFRRSGEMAGSGDSGSAVVDHGSGGRWSAVGDAQSGTITLTYGSGASEALPFSVSTRPADRSAYGPGVTIGGTLYQKTGPGGC